MINGKVRNNIQTFLPYPDFNKCAQCLDNKRLGKQRVEAYQILRTLLGESEGWKNHPAVKMWKGYEYLLYWYLLAMIHEWKLRGYKDSISDKALKLIKKYPNLTIVRGCPYPLWMGGEIHLTHQSNLIRKNLEHYRKIFGEDIPDNLPYYWPTKEKKCI